MKNNTIENVCAVLLAAGRGSRMKATDKNKVAYEIAGKPMIVRAIEVLRNTGIKNIIVVVGFAKESVLKLLDSEIISVEQKKRLGTGHALKVALKKVPNDAQHIFVLNGDDSFLLSSDLLSKLFSYHIENNLSVTFLSLETPDSTGLGRVVRQNGQVVGVVEEKDANEMEKRITEVNAACYLFKSDFAKSFINKIDISPNSGEYYIVKLIEIASKQKLGVDAYKLEGFKWRGVNTQQELAQAEEMFVAK